MPLEIIPPQEAPSANVANVGSLIPVRFHVAVQLILFKESLWTFCAVMYLACFLYRGYVRIWHVGEVISTASNAMRLEHVLPGVFLGGKAKRHSRTSTRAAGVGPVMSIAVTVSCFCCVEATVKMRAVYFWALEPRVTMVHLHSASLFWLQLIDDKRLERRP